MSAVVFMTNDTADNSPVAFVTVSTTAVTATGEFGRWVGVVANVRVSCVVPAVTPVSDDRVI